MKDNTEGAVHEVILETATGPGWRCCERITVVEEHERRFADRPQNRRLEDDERERSWPRSSATGDRRPAAPRRDVAYDVKDVVGTGGFGIGSAGLPAYNVLLEGYDQALENDVVLSIKQGNVAAPSRIVDDPELREYFEHEGTGRRSASARCRPTPPSSSATPRSAAWASSSPSSRPTSWTSTGRTSPSPRRSAGDGPAGAGDREAAPRRRRRQRPLARAFQMEEAITAMIGDRREEFVADLVQFAHDYARRTQEDHLRLPSTPSAPARSRGSARAARIRRRSSMMPTCGPMPGLSNGSVTTVKPIRS